MLIAARPLSIGDFQLQPGDPITSEMEDLLPPGRLLKLESAGWLRQKSVEDKLEARVAVLEEQVALLTQKITRAPRAPEPQE